MDKTPGTKVSVIEGVDCTCIFVDPEAHEKTLSSSYTSGLTTYSTYTVIALSALSLCQVTVKGGTTVSEIVLYLEERGLALPSLPATLDQTIAGAISTGRWWVGSLPCLHCLPLSIRPLVEPSAQVGGG